MTKKIRVHDLPHMTGGDIPINKRPFLLCEVCSSKASAEAGDYFMYDPDMVMTCCNTPMQLVTARVVYTDWTG